MFKIDNWLYRFGGVLFALHEQNKNLRQSFSNGMSLGMPASHTGVLVSSPGSSVSNPA